jgi:hypothetical protein
MVGRAVLAILVTGLTAAGVLSLRQARLQAAHEMTQARLRVKLLHERIADLRAEIAAVTAPQELERERLALQQELMPSTPAAEPIEASELVAAQGP